MSVISPRRQKDRSSRSRSRDGEGKGDVGSGPEPRSPSQELEKSARSPSGDSDDGRRRDAAAGDVGRLKRKKKRKRADSVENGNHAGENSDSVASDDEHATHKKRGGGPPGSSAHERTRSVEEAVRPERLSKKRDEGGARSNGHQPKLNGNGVVQSASRGEDKTVTLGQKTNRGGCAGGGGGVHEGEDGCGGDEGCCLCVVATDEYAAERVLGIHDTLIVPPREACLQPRLVVLLLVT